MSDVNYFHSYNSAIEEVKNRQENQQYSATPASLTFRTFTKNDKESGNTIQSRLFNETIVSNLKKLGFDTEIEFPLTIKKSQYSNSNDISTEIKLADTGYGQSEHTACRKPQYHSET